MTTETKPDLDCPTCGGTGVAPVADADLGGAGVTNSPCSDCGGSGKDIAACILMLAELETECPCDCGHVSITTTDACLSCEGGLNKVPKYTGLRRIRKYYNHNFCHPDCESSDEDCQGRGWVPVSDERVAAMVVLEQLVSGFPNSVRLRQENLAGAIILAAVEMESS